MRPAKLRERLPVLRPQTVKQHAALRRGKRLEHPIRSLTHVNQIRQQFGCMSNRSVSSSSFTTCVKARI
jgi:hypothetical protein